MSTPFSDAPISLGANARFHERMDVKEIRRENLAALVSKRGSRKPLAEAIGTDPAYISQLLSDKTKADMGHQLARRIEKALGKPRGWMDRSHREAGMSVLEAPAAYEEAPARAPGGDFVAVQRVSINVEAGITGFHVQQLEGNGDPIFFRRDYLDKKGWRANQLHAIRVSGDSMEPALYPGDLVVINAALTDPVDGEVFAVNYEGQPVIKRLRRDAGAWWLDSDNPRHKPKLCDENALIIGRVVYKQSERI